MPINVQCTFLRYFDFSNTCLNYSRESERLSSTVYSFPLRSYEIQNMLFHDPSHMLVPLCSNAERYQESKLNFNRDIEISAGTLNGSRLIASSATQYKEESYKSQTLPDDCALF